MHLDDIEEESVPRVEQYLNQIKVLRQIAHKLIKFLEQLENFQKKLWLKKKFVVETNYCITLDRVPEELYPEICANDAQRKEWVELFAIDEIKKELGIEGYSEPLTEDFLRQQQSLPLDTIFFSNEIKKVVLSGIDNYETRNDGLVINGENFQTLNFLSRRYTKQIQCTYIDPPYNTGGDGFVYKDNYQHSSWLSMINDRLRQLPTLSGVGAPFFASVDDNEQAHFKQCLDSVFGESCFETQVIVQSNKRGQTYQSIAKTHEYLIVYGIGSVPELHELPKEVAKNALKDSKGIYELWELRNRNPKFGRHNRPNLYYPFYVAHETTDKNGYASVSLAEDDDHLLKVTPKNSEGVDSCWRWGTEKVQQALTEEPLSVLVAKQKRDGGWNIYEKARKGTKKAKSIWEETEVINEQGTVELRHLGFREFGFPKPVGLLKKIIQVGANKKDLILDFFAGSGTTGHAVISKNHEDGGKRKYILVEMGDHFKTVILPRLKKVIYSSDWRDGKPVSRQGSSHMFKYISLESYEDALNNLTIKRTDTQKGLLDTSLALKEEYMLSYMMDMETEGSASLLNVDRFDDPWNYTMKIATGSAGETKVRPVDLVETFNYLIGLTVIRRDFIRGIEVIEGTSPDGNNVLVIWRNTNETNNEQLDEFFRKQDYNTRDTEFDLIYVNGDNNLENLRRPDQTWKVRLIEDDFKQLMFDVEDV
nr:site-specific DNA-methyltransferase [Pseudodesulfovibrio sp. JC047]